MQFFDFKMRKVPRVIWSFLRIPVLTKYLRIFKNSLGSLYVETLMAMTILGIIGASILPLYPKLLQDTKKVGVNAQLTTLASYVGDYVFRWVGFSPTAKRGFSQQISSYTDGQEFELR